MIWQKKLSVLSYSVGHEGAYDLCVVQRECQQCQTGKYGVISMGVALCLDSPAAASTLLAGRINLANCTSFSGYTGPGGAKCLICAAGTYKESFGQDECTYCLDDKTTDPIRKSSQACECKPGFSANGSSCVACAVGTYNSAIGRDCLSCQGNSTTFSPASVSVAACGCSTGYPQGGLSCVACEQVKFKTQFGPQDCTPCPEFASTSATGSHSLQQCVCEPGLIRNGLSCQICSVGQYHDAAAGICKKCESCLAGHFLQDCANLESLEIVRLALLAPFRLQ